MVDDPETLVRRAVAAGATQTSPVGDEHGWRLGRIVHDLTIDERVGALVHLLADGDAQTRERADWALRQGGAAVVPLLKKELRPDLSAEQRRRLEKIIAELAPPPR